MKAVSKDSTTAVELLMKAGADVQAKDFVSLTPHDI